MTARKPRAKPDPAARIAAGRHAEARSSRPAGGSGRAAPAARAIREVAEQAAAAGAEVRKARWRDVLGDDLATRVALACARAGEDPADWCRRQLADQVGVLERKAARRAETARARSRCKHPDKDRRGNRCGACGTRGLPGL